MLEVEPPIERRRRWTHEQARAMLHAQAASGLSMRAYAKRQGLDPQRLYLWRQKLQRSESPRVRLVEIGPPTARIMEVVSHSGMIVRVSESIASEALERVVSVMMRVSTC